MFTAALASAELNTNLVSQLTRTCRPFHHDLVTLGLMVSELASHCRQADWSAFDVAMHLLSSLRELALKEQITVLDHHSTPPWTTMFVAAMRPFCTMLAGWVLQGRLEDPAGEFLVCRHYEAPDAATRHPDHWLTAHQVRVSRSGEPMPTGRCCAVATVLL